MELRYPFCGDKHWNTNLKPKWILCLVQTPQELVVVIFTIPQFKTDFGLGNTVTKNQP